MDKCNKNWTNYQVFKDLIFSLIYGVYICISNRKVKKSLNV